MAEEREEGAIEISIEALTGIVYDLCISPYETVFGIKLKVQRLEGIPVYQQQLVWGEVELQDELCLEEYSIPSGAQLKLMVAMRGGPIHAQRVQVDLEDQTFLEITEFLDTQGGDKYALMLLRSGDDLEHSSIVQVVQMLAEEEKEGNGDAISSSRVSVAGQPVDVAASKHTQSEHAMTRDKMAVLMAKLKKGKSFFQKSQISSNQLSRKAIAKDQLLESRTPGRPLTASRGTLLESTHFNEARRVDRRLVFGRDEQSLSGPVLCSSSGKGRVTSCPHRTYDPDDQELPVISRKSCSRIDRNRSSRPPSQLRMEVSPEVEGVNSVHGLEKVALPSTTTNTSSSLREVSTRGMATDQSKACQQRTSKRKRRTSEIDTNSPSSSLADLSTNLSRLDLGSPLHPPSLHPSLLPMNPKCPVQKDNLHKYRTFRTVQDKVLLTPYSATAPHLPPIAHPYLATPTTLASVTRVRSRGLTEHLPSLVVSTTGKQDVLTSASRKKRCMKCGRRVGLASTFSCRCGRLFCALHRYAETHGCTFDYKTEGRQLLARTNPIISAQKLPKI